MVTSDNPRTEDPQAIIDDILKGTDGFDTPKLVEPDRRAAIRGAVAMLGPDDLLVLAGKGHETYQEVNGEKRHLDEREEIGACYH